MNQTNVKNNTKVTAASNAPLATSVPQNVASLGVPEEDIKVTTDQLEAWLGKLYDDVLNTNDKDLFEMYDLYKYKGFDRNEVLKMLKQKVPDNKTAIHLILVCALNGPQRASKANLFNGKTPIQMGIPASGGQGKRVLTCNKISAATADIAAFYMKKVNVPKRMMVECPAWLQFPAAGGVKLPDHLRKQHIEFSRRFSEQIGGVFQEQIYNQMAANAYLDERFKLFN